MQRYLLAVPVILGLSMVDVSASLISESDIVNNWTAENSVAANIYSSSNSLNNATWAVFGNTVANSGNRSGSLTSDFIATGDWSFSTEIRPNGDNDSFGLVFGFQDFENTYALLWGGGGVSTLNGIKLHKVVADSATTLASQAGNWISGVTYTVTASRSGNDISVSVDQGGSNIFSQTIADTTYMSGRVGFDTFSQNTSFSFGETDFTSISGAVPEPTTVAVWSLLGLAGAVIMKRQAKQWACD